MNRRDFLHTFGIGAAVTGLGAFPYEALAAREIVKLTILHTNDVHSRIDPFPMDGGRNQGLGGAVRRALLIEKIRKEEKNVLLLDCGDIFQGTPYFNYYGGELEMKLMTQMGYEAATLGNHDFDLGVEGFAKQMKHANFPILNCNYDFKNTALENKTIPFKIFTKNNVRIGVIGIGIELKGLVPKKMYGETQYNDPTIKANFFAKILKEEEKCDYVICLSHLGYEYKDDTEKISDKKFAARSRDIDLILGGHTHTFMNRPDVVYNLDNKPVIINQVGWGGIMLGRLDVYLSKRKVKMNVTSQNQYLGEMVNVSKHS